MTQHKYNTFAVFLGALCTLGFAPFGITVALLCGFGLCYFILCQKITKQEAFLAGIWFGLSHFSTSLYWLGIALATDIAKFGWLIPFAVFGLSLFFSVYFAFAFLTFKVFRRKNPFTFAVIFYFFEFLRAKLFSGFPWNLVGYTWHNLEILQSASVFGIWGLSFLTYFIAGTIGALIYQNKAINQLYLCFCIGILIVIFCFGYIRLQNNPTEYTNKKIRIVQANISHQAQWTQEYAQKVIDSYVNLTLSKSLDNIDYIIWPESSVPYLLASDSTNIPTELFRIITKTLIVGGERIRGNKIFNTIFIFQDGKIKDYYDKVHLVPFGEYIPFRGFLPIKKIVSGLSDFSSGQDKQKILHSINVLPVICYESVFSGSLDRSYNVQWVVNLTNDSWFGKSIGPYQHFYMTRLRAIESGLPLVRSTTTGISGVFDAYGRIITKINLEERAILDVSLPKKIPSSTIYTKIKRAIFSIPASDQSF